MRVTINKKAFEFAKQLIHQGKFSDKRGSGDLNHAQPSKAQEDEFLKSHSWNDFSNWHLGVHHDRPENTRNRYEFPIGDFNLIHRSDLLEIQKRAHNNNFDDIAKAAQELVALMDKKIQK
jgi:hypothetical protein